MCCSFCKVFLRIPCGNLLRTYMGAWLGELTYISVRSHRWPTECLLMLQSAESKSSWKIHKFQLWMSRFERRWRVQWSAISIVNCRIPWADRNLNAYCAFGISLKACVLQWLQFAASAIAATHKISFYCGSLFLKPCRVPFGYSPEGCDWQGRCVSVSLQVVLSWSWPCLPHCGSCCREVDVAKTCHEIRLANSLNLSI